MQLSDIIQNNIAAVDKAGVSVHVVSILGHVSIKDTKGNEVFLQGDDGSCFISKSKALWDEVGNIGMDEAYKFYAYDYLELLQGV